MEIKNRPDVSLFSLSWDPGCTRFSSCHFVCLCPSPSPRSHACFCFAGPVAGCGIPAQWALYNWESCLLFSPPPHFLTFFIFPLRYPPLNIWTDFFFFKRQPSPHQSLRLSGSICCFFSSLFPLDKPRWTLPVLQPFTQNTPLLKRSGLYRAICWWCLFFFFFHADQTSFLFKRLRFSAAQ